MKTLGEWLVRGRTRSTLMTLEEYQNWAITTRVYDGKIPMLVYATLKLTGEAGEFSEKIGKAYRDNDGVLDLPVREALLYELGDIMWYLANAAEELDSNLEQVAIMNQIKINDRKARGVLKGSGDSR